MEAQQGVTTFDCSGLQEVVERTIAGKDDALDDSQLASMRVELRVAVSAVGPLDGEVGMRLATAMLCHFSHVLSLLVSIPGGRGG